MESCIFPHAVFCFDRSSRASSLILWLSYTLFIIPPLKKPILVYLWIIVASFVNIYLDGVFRLKVTFIFKKVPILALPCPQILSYQNNWCGKISSRQLSFKKSWKKIARIKLQFCFLHQKYRDVWNFIAVLARLRKWKKCNQRK